MQYSQRAKAKKRQRLGRKASRLGASLSRLSLSTAAVVASGVGVAGLSSLGAGNTAYAQPVVNCNGPEVVMTTQGSTDGANNVQLVDINTRQARTIIAATATGDNTIPGMRFPNQVAIADGGGTIFFTAVLNNQANVIEYDLASDTYTTTVSNTRGVAGAVNPENGQYYFGRIQESGSPYDSYDPATNTITQDVATLNLPGAPAGNGDIAFDRSGNLYVVSSSLSQYKLYRVEGPLPKPSAGNTVNLTGEVLAQGSTSGQVNGIAFGNDGFLYTSGTAIRKFNPTTGELIEQRGPSGTDLASCADPNRVRIYKSFPNGRVSSSDQVKMEITGGGIALANSAQTTGNEVGLQTQDPSEYIGPLLLVGPNEFTFTEQGLPSGSTLDKYSVKWDCFDETADKTISSGTGTTGKFTLPQDAFGQDIFCTFFNVPKGKVTLQKDLPQGRVNDSDQFVLTLDPGSNVTTTGTKSGVQDQKVVDNAAVLGTTYKISEAAADGTDLGFYTTSWKCLDAANGNQIVASGTGTAGEFVMPGPTGTATADVVCTFTNAAKTPGLDVFKTSDPVSTTPVTAGQIIEYTINFANTGGAPAAIDYIDDLTGLVDDATITTDPKLATGEGLTVSAVENDKFTIKGTLAPGAKATVTYKATVKADGQRGDDNVLNFVIKPGETTPPTCEPSNRLCTTHPVASKPDISLVKSVVEVIDNDNSNSNTLGDVIRYSFLVTNTGNVTLKDIVLTDPKLSADPLACPKTTLEPSEEMTCVAPPYTITAADVAAGEVLNVATVTGVSPKGEKVTSESQVTVKPVTGIVLPPTTTTLPTTGSSLIVSVSGIAAVLLGAGAALMLLQRSRNRLYDVDGSLS